MGLCLMPMRQQPGIVMRRILLALLILVVALLAGWRSSLNRGAVSLLEPVSSVLWTLPDQPRFGGLSGLEISDDGLHLLAVSDKPALFAADLTRNNGTITAIETQPMVRPRTPNDNAYHDEVNNDLEGLAYGPDGKIWITTEQYNDVEYFEPGTFVAYHIAQNDMFRKLDNNRGLEAIAVTQAGVVLTLPEDWPTADYPVFAFDGHAWSEFGTIPVTGGYAPVGADVAPDGSFYLLERRLQLPWGFSSRVRRFTIAQDGLIQPKLLLQTPFGTHGNLEGLAVWQDSAGDTRFTMVVDDNFSRFQKTRLVEYRLPASENDQD